MLDRLSLPTEIFTDDAKAFALVPFTEHDVPEIVANEKRCSAHPWCEEHFRSSFSARHLNFGVKAEDRWIAHAVFSIVAREAELLILGVLPEYRRLGVARVFLTAIESLLTSLADEIFLEVRASNGAAIQLYEGLGFNCLGERPNYYPLRGHLRENALIYGKYLAGGE